MAHFAKLDKAHYVTDVTVIHNNVLLDSDGNEQEQLGIDFLINTTGHSWWVQTSYNESFRGNFAGKGYIYNKTLDMFIAPKPFPSWTLDSETGKWVSPVVMPEMTETKIYEWDESITNWKEINLDV
jgi:hypothetical protein